MKGVEIVDTEAGVWIVKIRDGVFLGYYTTEDDGEGGSYYVAFDSAGNCCRWDQSWQSCPYRDPRFALGWILNSCAVLEVA